MKGNNFLFILVIFFLLPSAFSQDVDENRLQGITERFHNGDDGTVLSKREGADEHENIVEIVFCNPSSNKKIYYIGADFRGDGIFLAYNNKEIILEIPIIYGPKIIWHGEDIAEIIVPTGSPFTHSYFYDFEDSQISLPYDFPIYYDIENKAVLVWGNVDFELYDIKTNNILKIYNLRRINGMTPAWPYIQYYAERRKAEIILYYSDWTTDTKGKMILEIRLVQQPGWL
jgi:hypothetical protein